MVFLIDYENVTSAGIEGIDKLAETDSVYIFYTAAQQSISFDMHRAILEAKAKISYFAVANGGKNALDFQLASFIGYLVGLSDDKSIYVVSGDKGFQFIWKFWERQSVEGLSIYTVPSIIKALKHDRLITDTVTRYTLDDLSESAEAPKETVPKETAPKESAVETVPAKPVISDSELFEEFEAAMGRTEDPSEAIVETVTFPDDLTEKISGKKTEDVPAAEEPTAEETAPAPVEKKRTTRRRVSGRKTAEKKAEPAPLNIKQMIYANIDTLIGGAGFEDKSVIWDIADIVLATKDKQQFYTGVIKALGKEKGLEVYNLLRPEYTNLKKMVE